MQTVLLVLKINPTSRILTPLYYEQFFLDFLIKLHIFLYNSDTVVTANLAPPLRRTIVTVMGLHDDNYKKNT